MNFIDTFNICRKISIYLLNIGRAFEPSDCFNYSPANYIYNEGERMMV